MPYFTSDDDPVRAPYGTWRSPITAEMVAQGTRPLSEARVRRGPGGRVQVWCLQRRPDQGGRVALFRWDGAGGAPIDVAPEFNVRSRVHEYGGGAYQVCEGGIAFTHFADNRVHWLADGGEEPVPVTDGGNERCADFEHDAARRRLLAVRELHGEGHEPVNTLCAIALDGDTPDVTVLAQGHDFYSSPRLSPDGTQLCWLTWDHPRMPWEGCELWVAALDEHGMPGEPQRVAGGPAEAICQPSWSPDGQLYFVSDRSNWWNLYRHDPAPGARPVPVLPMSAEFGVPHWVFGQSRYAFNGPGEIVCAYIDMGTSFLGRIDLASGTLSAVEGRYATHLTDVQDLRVDDGMLVLIAGGPQQALELSCIDLDTGKATVLARSLEKQPEPGYLSNPEAIDYATSGARTAHAFYYRPQNRDFVGHSRAAPPLIVIGHGGPTGMATSTLSLGIQYWTSRGFAVLDVNYGGSTGFGRTYRDALKGRWGVIDVDDCVNGARFLVEHGMADGNRLVIRGSSAGGLTTLCALTFHDVFKAGASYYGVSDLQGLDDDSHKFESHYNEWLIAPKEKAAAVYRERSPIHHTAALKKPMIFFQGLDDKVVPPQQSEAMVAALKAAGLPVAYLAFEGEGHGFRQAATIVRTLEAELYFYLKVFGMSPPPGPAPVEILNLSE